MKERIKGTTNPIELIPLLLGIHPYGIAVGQAVGQLVGVTLPENLTKPVGHALEVVVVVANVVVGGFRLPGGAILDMVDCVD